MDGRTDVTVEIVIEMINLLLNLKNFVKSMSVKKFIYLGHRQIILSLRRSVKLPRVALHIMD